MERTVRRLVKTKLYQLANYRLLNHILSKNQQGTTKNKSMRASMEGVISKARFSKIEIQQYYV